MGRETLLRAGTDRYSNRNGCMCAPRTEQPLRKSLRYFACTETLGSTVAMRRCKGV